MKKSKGSSKKREQKNEQSAFAYFISSTGCLPSGYHRLIDAPEVTACIDQISAIISGATIYLMENSKTGDRRVNDNLARFVDETPWPNRGTRATWMSWIVATLLADGDGNACVLPHYSEGLLTALEPMPGAMPFATPDGYQVLWNGRNYAPDEILHFRLFADLSQPWLGRGYRVQAANIAKSLRQTEALKDSLSSPKYKPPLIIKVNSDVDFSEPGARDAFREEYLESSDSGKPWIIPADMMDVMQVKPLTLTDLAIKDTVELDKKTVASIYGVPPFLLGVGHYDQNAFNAWIRTRIVHICKIIEQEMTDKLLVRKDRYWKINRRHLYAYDMRELVEMYNHMADRGYVNGDTVREAAMLEPEGLTEYKVLENYIPYDLSGKQKKLNVSNLDTDTETEDEDA